jgi:hypothetical protein
VDVLAIWHVGVNEAGGTEVECMEPTDNIDILSPLGVPASQLKVGTLYFIVSYVTGTRLLWPEIQSLVYLGENVTGDALGTLFFQDPSSHCSLGPFPQIVDEDIYLLTAGPELPPNLFELDGVLDELSRCAARQSRAAVNQTPSS